VHALPLGLQWGQVQYHEQSLKNLQEAMKLTKKLCAVVVDTLGREMLIRRPFTIDEHGWTCLEGEYEVRRQPPSLQAVAGVAVCCGIQIRARWGGNRAAAWLHKQASKARARVRSVPAGFGGLRSQDNGQRGAGTVVRRWRHPAAGHLLGLQPHGKARRRRLHRKVGEPARADRHLRFQALFGGRTRSVGAVHARTPVHAPRMNARLRRLHSPIGEGALCALALVLLWLLQEE
jgi:hypothetical protein